MTGEVTAKVIVVDSAYTFVDLLDDDGETLARFIAESDDVHTIPLATIEEDKLDLSAAMLREDIRLAATADEITVHPDAASCRNAVEADGGLVIGLLSTSVFNLFATGDPETAHPYATVCGEILSCERRTNDLSGVDWYRVVVDAAFPLTIAVASDGDVVPAPGMWLSGQVRMVLSTGFWGEEPADAATHDEPDEPADESADLDICLGTAHLPDWWFTDITTFADSAVVVRAAEVSAHVSGLRLDGDVLVAAVHGTGDYEVHLDLDHPLTCSTCTCPHAGTEYFCKHLVAVSMTLDHLRRPMIDDLATHTPDRDEAVLLRSVGMLLRLLNAEITPQTATDLTDIVTLAASFADSGLHELAYTQMRRLLEFLHARQCRPGKDRVTDGALDDGVRHAVRVYLQAREACGIQDCDSDLAWLVRYHRDLREDATDILTVVLPTLTGDTRRRLNRSLASWESECASGILLPRVGAQQKGGNAEQNRIFAELGTIARLRRTLSTGARDVDATVALLLTRSPARRVTALYLYDAAGRHDDVARVLDDILRVGYVTCGETTEVMLGAEEAAAWLSRPELAEVRDRAAELLDPGTWGHLELLVRLAVAADDRARLWEVVGASPVPDLDWRDNELQNRSGFVDFSEYLYQQIGGDRPDLGWRLDLSVAWSLRLEHDPDVLPLNALRMLVAYLERAARGMAASDDGELFADELAAYLEQFSDVTMLPVLVEQKGLM